MMLAYATCLDPASSSPFRLIVDNHIDFYKVSVSTSIQDLQASI